MNKGYFLWGGSIQCEGSPGVWCKHFQQRVEMETSLFVHSPTFRSISWVAQLGRRPGLAPGGGCEKGQKPQATIPSSFDHNYKSILTFPSLMKSQIAYERWWQQDLLSSVNILGFPSQLICLVPLVSPSKLRYLIFIYGIELKCVYTMICVITIHYIKSPDLVFQGGKLQFFLEKIICKIVEITFIPSSYFDGCCLLVQCLRKAQLIFSCMQRRERLNK